MDNVCLAKSVAYNGLHYKSGMRNNERVITDKMANTFAYRRHEVVNQEPSIQDFKDRWPALFTQKEVSMELK